jgi:hypothetical protein
MPEVAEGAEEELRTEPMHLWDELIQLVPPSSCIYLSLSLCMYSPSLPKIP